MKPGRVNFILWGILAAIIAGVFVGVYFPDVAEKFKFLGSLFFNALFLIIVPLIVASMIVGITSLGDIRKLGRTARHTITYFMITSAVAVILGMILGVTFTPGEVGESLSASADKKTAGEIEELKFADISSQSVMVDSSLRFVLRAENGESVLQLGAIGLPAGATFVDKGFGVGQFSWTPGERQAGQYSVSFFVNDRYSGVSTRTMRVNVTDPSDLGVYGMLARIGEAMIQTLNEMIPRNIVAAAADTKVLALIVFSLFFGGVLSSLGAKAKPLITLFEVINDAVMKLVHLVMYLAPFGVFGIVASKVGEKSGDLANAAVGIGMFSAVVILGQVIHGGLLMGVLKYLGNRNPIAYLSNMGPALATALGVSSSSATLPVTMECVVENNKVDQRAASFVLPLGTTINMDGTAMYQALSAIFVCQLFGIPLGIEHYVIMLITAILASVGTPGIPQAGIVMMAVVMGSVGVPAEVIGQGVSIILVVDWALDRGRTVLNVFGDAVGAAVIANTYEFKTARARSGSVSASRGSQRERSSGRQGAGERRTGRGGGGYERRGGRDRERSPRRADAQRGERSSRYEKRDRSPRRDDRDSRNRGATGRGSYQSRPRPERDTRKSYDKEETRQASPAPTSTPAQKSEAPEATIDFGQLSQSSQRSSGFTSGTESSEFNIEINVPEIDFANDPALKSGGPSGKDDDTLDDTLIEKQEVPDSDQAHVPEKLDERETEKPATSESIEENQGQQEDSFGRTKKRKPGA